MLKIVRMGIDYKHGKDFKIFRPDGYDCYLALFIKTRSELIDDGHTIVAEPDTFILFDKNSPHYYAAVDDEYVDDWIQLECDEEFFREFSVPVNKPIHVGNVIWVEGYYRLICDAFFKCNTHGVLEYLLRSMFGELSQMVQTAGERSVYVKQLVELRREVYSYPWKKWSISNMAESMRLSVPYFQEVYKKVFNVSCMADVISGRIIYAKNLLDNSTLSIEEIAFKCGYNSVVHFSRQFRKETGMSPTVWRKRERFDM